MTLVDLWAANQQLKGWARSTILNAKDTGQVRQAIEVIIRRTKIDTLSHDELAIYSQLDASFGGLALTAYYKNTKTFPQNLLDEKTCIRYTGHYFMAGAPFNDPKATFYCQGSMFFGAGSPEFVAYDVHADKETRLFKANYKLLVEQKKTTHE